MSFSFSVFILNIDLDQSARPQALVTVLAQKCDVLSIRICDIMGFVEII